MKKRFYITITDMARYYGRAPFEVGVIMKLSKNRSNGAEQFDIRVTMPLIGTVGRVASSPLEVAGGTQSAERIYNNIGKVAYAQIMFITDTCVIAKVLSAKEVIKTPYLKAYIKKPKEREKRLVC